MNYLFLLASVWFSISYSITKSVDHDTYIKTLELHTLNIEIKKIYEELYEHCPLAIDRPDIVTDIFGRRRSSQSDLDLKIRLAQHALTDLTNKYHSCTSGMEYSTGTIVWNTRSTASTTIHTSFSKTTKTTSTPKQPAAKTIPTSTESTRTSALTYRTTTASSSSLKPTTVQSGRHAFTVLQTKNTTYRGYNFLALKVRVPVDGLSRSESWCRDYQYLCEHFGRRPTGCGLDNPRVRSPLYDANYDFKRCRDEYNSDMNIGDTLGCSPSSRIAEIGNAAFPNSSPPAMNDSNAFGFVGCKLGLCQKTIDPVMDSSMMYMTAFSAKNPTAMYTICR